MFFDALNEFALRVHFRSLGAKKHGMKSFFVCSWLNLLLKMSPETEAIAIDCLQNATFDFLSAFNRNYFNFFKTHYWYPLRLSKTTEFLFIGYIFDLLTSTRTLLILEKIPIIWRKILNCWKNSRPYINFFIEQNNFVISSNLT